MGMIEQEYKELRKLQADYAAKKITSMELNDHLKVYKRTQALQNNMIKIEQMRLQAGNNTPVNKLIEQNLIGNRIALNLKVEERGLETIRCTYNEKIITRDDCLDYSGSHMDQCAGCHHNKATKQALID